MASAVSFFANVPYVLETAHNSLELYLLTIGYYPWEADLI